jgi:hypothetical protein
MKMDIEDIAAVLVNLQRGISKCVGGERYAQAAELANSYASILAALSEKQRDKLCKNELRGI